MTEFKDRISTNLNRRRLDVVDVVTDNGGNITSIVADISRSTSEGNTVVGTALNASDLTDTILSVINKQIFGVEVISSGGLNIEWMQDKGNMTTKRVQLNLTGPRLYAKEYNDANFMCNADNSPAYIFFYLSDTQSLNTSNGPQVKIQYSIELYSDSNCINYVTRLLGTVTYIPESEVGED